MSTTHQDPSPGHEPYTARLRPVVVSLLILTFGTWAVFVGMRSLFNALTARGEAAQAPVHPLHTGPELPPEPRLQAYPAREIAEHRAAVEELSTSYGWGDESARLVRLPLERALELTLERGLPVWPAVTEDEPGAQPPEAREPAAGEPR